MLSINYFLILGCLLLILLSAFPTIRVFSNESALCISWPNYWSFSFSISPSNEYSALISFRIDWFDLFAVQGTLKSLLHMTTGKTIALIIQIFVGKVVSLLFNRLSRFVIALLSRSKCCLAKGQNFQQHLLSQYLLDNYHAILGQEECDNLEDRQNFLPL